MGLLEKAVNFKEYEAMTHETASYPKHLGIMYTVLGLNGEAGEVAEKLKKILRDKPKEGASEEDIIEIEKELGDVLWYVARCAHEMGSSLEAVAKMNMEKLISRKNRGTLHGNGDNR